MVSRERGQAAPSAVAAVSVIAIVVATVAFLAGGDGDGDAAATRPQAQSSSLTTPEPSPGERQASATPEQADGAAEDGPDRAKPRSGERDRADRGKRDQQERKKRRERPRPTPTPDGPPQVYVEVYNNTSISGLAASTAAELQDGGWQVVGVDNWYGDIPATTVYYPDGMYAEAGELAEALGASRVRPAVAPMKFDRLTVILTPDAA